MNIQLTPHFNILEFIRSSRAKELGIKNLPSPEEVENCRLLCLNLLEPLRVRIGRPITIQSGGRSKQLNAVTPDAEPTSDHRLWRAADIIVSGLDNLLLAALVSTRFKFDQCILEFYHPGFPLKSWVHLSWRAEGNRNQVLHTLMSDDGKSRVRDEKGRIRYFPGLPATVIAA